VPLVIEILAEFWSFFTGHPVCMYDLQAIVHIGATCVTSRILAALSWRCIGAFTLDTGRTRATRVKSASGRCVSCETTSESIWTLGRSRARSAPRRFASRLTSPNTSRLTLQSGGFVVATSGCFLPTRSGFSALGRVYVGSIAW